MSKKVEQRPQSNVRFIHCRNLNEDGSINPKGGMTVAYNINKEGLVVGWAAASCHIRDTYNKLIGRMKASGRLLSDKYYKECPEIEEKTFISNTITGFDKFGKVV